MADDLDADDNFENGKSADDALEETRQSDGLLPGQAGAESGSVNIPSTNPHDDSDVDITEKYQEEETQDIGNP